MYTLIVTFLSVSLESLQSNAPQNALGGKGS